jgi:hypothetical protein
LATQQPDDSSTKRKVWINYERPKFYPKQFEAVFDSHRFSCIEASTKAGKTSSCIAWLVEQALGGKPGCNYWWVAPVSDQSFIAFRRMMRALPRNMYKATLKPTTITLINGTVIWFKSGDKPDSLYGEDVYAVVIDEASRTKEDSFIAIRSTLTFTRGPARLIGNIRGRKNWFFKLARRAEQEQNAGKEPRELAYHKIVADDAVAAGVLDRKEIDDARDQLPEGAFKELYLCEASDDGGNPFGLGHIEACVRPLSDKPPLWWGWDFAKKHDYTVGIGLDEDGVVCRFLRFHKPWGETLNEVIAATGTVPALGDSTGVGDPIVEDLTRELGASFQGWQFTSQSKQKLMEGLAVAIQSRRIWYPKGPIQDELEQFEFVVTRTGVSYSAPEGFYDDCVCALALANMCRTVIPSAVVITNEMLQRARQMPRTRRH